MRPIHSLTDSSFLFFFFFSLSLKQSAQAVQNYGIVAVQPATEKLFQAACGTLEVDVICFDMTRRVEYKFRIPQVSQAIQRGIFFEINIGQALRDFTARQHLFNHSAQIITTARGKNIIMSSGARKPFEMRGPYDIMNLSVT
jgi:ribonuclease P/MRP protein subunit RPP1